jgi:hypothetical protein
LLLFACGGSSRPAPKPLQFHYDEVYIAQFSLEEKSTVLKAQNEYQMARAEQMKAEADLNESKTKLNVAKNERKQALLSERSAQQEKSAADKSGDMTRINRAAKDVRVAELTRRAADDKVSYIKANRKYLKRLVRYQAEETYHREARYEHEKARLGQSKNIAPKGVNYENYKIQTDKRSRLAQKARQELQRDKQKADEAKKVWQGRIKEAEQAKGVKKDTSTESTSAPESEGN